MNVIYNIALIYGLTFIIGFFVSAIIWILFKAITAKRISLSKIVRHESSYSEMKQLKH